MQTKEGMLSEDDSLDQPMLENRTSDRSTQYEALVSPINIDGAAKRSRTPGGPYRPVRDDDQNVPAELQEKLAQSMYGCLKEFSNDLSIQYLHAQEEERHRFATQWSEMSSALQKIASAVDSKFEEQSLFRSTIADALSNMSCQNDHRFQEIIRHIDVADRSQESANMSDAPTKVPHRVPIKKEENYVPEPRIRQRTREQPMPDIAMSPHQSPPGYDQPPKYSHSATEDTHLPRRWANTRDIPWGNSPTVHNREMRLHKLNPPPKFEAKQLDSWFRHMRFWREMYSSVGEMQILSVVWLAATEDTRDILMDYSDSTKSPPQTRSMEEFLELIHKEFGQIHEVERMDKMQDILNYRRKSDSSIRMFWQKMNRLVQYAKLSGVCLPGDILSTQPLYSLMLTSAQKHLILSHFENSGNPKTMANLRTISIKLSGPYQSTTNGVLVAGTIDGDESPESSDSQSPSALVAHAKAKKKSKQ